MMLAILVAGATLLGGGAIHISAKMFGGSLAVKRGFGAALLISFATLASSFMLCIMFRSSALPFFITLTSVLAVMGTYRVGFVRGLVITVGAWVITWVG